MVNPPETPPLKAGWSTQPAVLVLYVATGAANVGLIKQIWEAVGVTGIVVPEATLAAAAGQLTVAPTEFRSSRMKFPVVTDAPAISML